MMDYDTQKAFAGIMEQIGVALQQWGNRQDVAELAMMNVRNMADHILNVQANYES